MNLEMMNESSQRHPKLSLIFTPNCLSKTSVTRMFVLFLIKNKQENLPPYPSVSHEF